MPILTLIRGLPGSGKTTLAQALVAAWKLAVHYEADFWMVNEDGDYHFDPSRLAFAHKKCQEAASDAMAVGGVGVVIANTFCREWEIEPYLRLAEKFGYTVQLLQCDGAYQNVHGVPPEKIEQMQERFVPFWKMVEYVSNR